MVSLPLSFSSGAQYEEKKDDDNEMLVVFF
jgi:hypothetical protein